ncbi:carbohydrate-binding family 9-like protein [Lentisphaerota bacterium WC36G]|nr:carbohydrate-binding family 9-like protein [Lentisphaerae bacterium WC36]
MNNYKINKTKNNVEFLTANYYDKFWEKAEVGKISNFLSESETFDVKSEFKLLYSDLGIFAVFKNLENSIRSEVKAHNSGSCADSCVEFFVKPNDRNIGYLNFEFTPLGFVHCSYVTDWKRKEGGALSKRDLLSAKEISMLKIVSDYKKNSDTNMWSLAFFIPFKLIQLYFKFDEKDLVNDNNWTANFYKCGDKTEKPHWIAWNEVNALNFHLPECFGILIFE